MTFVTTRRGDAHSVAWRRRRNAAAAALVLVVMLSAMACGGGAKGKAGAVGTNVPVDVTGGTPGAATPLTAAEQTVVALGPKTVFAPYSDPGGHFVAEVPQGWNSRGTQGGGVIFLLPDGGVTMEIDCVPGLTAGQLQIQDQSVQQQVTLGVVSRDPASTVHVNGQAYEIVPWSSTIGSLRLEHEFVYLDGKGCAWRLQLNGAPGHPLATWQPILNRLLQSFKPA
jgi:hypothetical protein